jgi:hypothetical protein
LVALDAACGRKGNFFWTNYTKTEVVIPPGLALLNMNIRTSSFLKSAFFIFINDALEATSLSFGTMESMTNVAKIIAGQA